ncbi:MAG: hypothetical protein UDT01_08405 [Blautia sp.]|uniref:hypothetical protein n=1 Tax=Blautia luti TaxID=89014 RepID=UPI001D0297B8|nr:hypothetical protein [Blautia luti]MCB5473123.1 hypothetical protein [Blautia luti]MEE0368500.1 hypothetical protein [Blautia sp.]
MIKKKYLKKIAVVAATAALLFQVQPAIAADIFEDGETTAAAEEIQEPEAVPMAAAEENAEAAETSEEAAAVEVAPVEIEPIEIEPIDIDIPAADDTESTEEPAEEAHPEESAQEEAEEITEAAVEESGAEGTSDQETEVPKENVEAEELQPETPEYKTDFQFENSEVKITATATEEAKLPQNTEMRAVKLEEGTAAYEEAKAASAQTLGTSDDASYCFYDVTFVADEQELSPEKGTVTIKMEFKNIQVNAEAQTQNIVHIEDTEAGRQVQDVTSVSGDGSNLQSVDFAM